MGDHIDDDHDRGYPATLGARLRSLRRQQHLSLQDVEAASDHEFKVSVLGAYERGERAISVPRLQRLARVYRVPVDRMVPRDEPGMAPSTAGQVADLTGGKHRDDRPVTIDLAALAQLREHEAEMLARYLRTIEVQRGDYNGRMLTIRRQDLTAIACIFGCPPRMRCPAGSTTWASALSPDPAPHSTPSHRRALTSSTQREPHWSRPPGKRAIRIKATLR